jgi:hypothetical protein
MQEARYSANFKRYLGKTDFMFTIRSDETAGQHLESVIQYVAACDEKGFKDDPNGNGKSHLAEGEESWPVNGYIVGPAKNKDGSISYALWMYGRGKYKTITIYSEKWDRLWFQPDTSKVWPVNQAPESDAARTSGFFVEVPEREIVIGSYTNREGDKRRFFDRVSGDMPAKPPAAEPPVTSTASGGAALADQVIAAVQTSATTPDLLIKFAEKASSRRPEIGTDWPRVQNVFRSKAVAIRHMNTTEKMLETVERLRSVLGETHYRDLMISLEPPRTEDDGIPF